MSDDVRQGIVHIVGPEQGWTLPGMTVVCGDSHTATHGAFGALAHGIGTSEVEHVLATQTLIQKKSKNMKVEITGKLQPGVTAKDITLAVIGETGTAGGTGYVIEYCGEAIRDLSMEGRMTVCNMAIEGGARAGLIAPDETTFEYVKGRPHAPKGAQWEAALDWWKTLYTDEGAHFDKVVTIRAKTSRRSSPGAPRPRTCCRSPQPCRTPRISRAARSRPPSAPSNIWAWTPGQKLTDIEIDTVFHRVLHQRPHRRPARRRGCHEGQEGQRRHARHDRAGLGPGAGAGRGRGPRPKSSRRPDLNGAWRAAPCVWR